MRRFVHCVWPFKEEGVSNYYWREARIQVWGIDRIYYKAVSLLLTARRPGPKVSLRVMWIAQAQANAKLLILWLLLG